MMKNQPSAKQRTSECVIYEAVFDLWGFTMPWIESISDAIHAHYESGDTCETYTCEANMSIRFQSCEKSRVDAVKSSFAKLCPLATRAAKGTPDQIGYHLMCG